MKKRWVLATLLAALMIVTGNVFAVKAADPAPVIVTVVSDGNYDELVDGDTLTLTATTDAMLTGRVRIAGQNMTMTQTDSGYSGSVTISGLADGQTVAADVSGLKAK